MSRPTTLERAFELARSGKYSGLGEIRDALKGEGHALSQLDGSPSLRNQLRKLCADAKGAENLEAKNTVAKQSSKRRNARKRTLPAAPVTGPVTKPTRKRGKTKMKQPKQSP